MARNRKWLNKEVVGWSMFDFANQAFTLVILTTMFQLYFVNHIVVDDESLGRQLWATSNMIGQAIVMVISPVIGALADFSGAKKRLLFLTYMACVLLTASLGLLTPGAVALGMILYIAGYLAFATGENFMGAFLPELAPHRDMGKVSAFGFTLGYIGGLLCLGGAVIVWLWMDNLAAYRWICLWAAIFFLLAALPTFLLLRERKQAETMPPGFNYFTIGFHRLATTFRSLKQYRHLFNYLLIFAFYFAGIQIVILFGGTIVRELFKFTVPQLGVYITISTVAAIVGAFVTLLFQDRIGARRTILINLGVWTLIMSLAIFITAEMQVLFWIVGFLVGFGMGSIGTASRSMVGLFSPQHKSAEFFGFYGLAHKTAAILGSGFTIIAEWIFGSGQYNLVVASSGIFFIGGFALMLLVVDEKAGRIAALRSARAHVRAHRDYVGPIE